MCKLCGAPIALGTFEIDHVIPVFLSFLAQQLELQALSWSHRTKTSLEARYASAAVARTALPTRPVFSPLDCIVPAEEGKLADLIALRGQGWYAKPVCAHLLEAGLAQWQHFKWSLDATAHVDQRCLEQVLQRMEQGWPEGENCAKLAINSLVGLLGIWNWSTP